MRRRDRLANVAREAASFRHAAIGYDPLRCAAYDDPLIGKRLLDWGFGFGPIKVRELAPDRLSFASGSSATDLLHVVKSENTDARRQAQRTA
jgi:hypothetical protein